MPGLIEFDGDCLIVLQCSLLAVAPEEGCALLLGNKQKSQFYQEKDFWKVYKIWPCCNIWEPEIFNQLDSSNKLNKAFPGIASKKNRFALDPREQINAQKWARENDLIVLGSAHSHPHGKTTPSFMDLSLAFSPGLMVIVNKSGNLDAWSIGENQTYQKLKVANLNF